MPFELVQRVTGHRTLAVVLRHYSRPGREDFRQVQTRPMPKMLGNGGGRSAKDEMRAIIEGAPPETGTRDKAKLVELIGRL